MYTIARHTFHHQTIAVHIDQIFRQLMGYFVMACFWGLFDIHRCLGWIQMALHPFDNQTASCNSPYDWLMSFAMGLTALCDMRMWKWHQWMPFVWFWLRHSIGLPLWGYPPASTLPLYRSATGIGYASKLPCKWQKIKLAIHPIVSG